MAIESILNKTVLNVEHQSLLHKIIDLENYRESFENHVKTQMVDIGKDLYHSQQYDNLRLLVVGQRGQINEMLSSLRKKELDLRVHAWIGSNLNMKVIKDTVIKKSCKSDDNIEVESDIFVSAIVSGSYGSNMRFYIAKFFGLLDDVVSIEDVNLVDLDGELIEMTESFASVVSAYLDEYLKLGGVFHFSYNENDGDFELRFSADEGTVEELYSYTVKCEYTLSGTLSIKAKSEDEASEQAYALPLPTNGEYIYDSFRILAVNQN